MSTNPRYPGTLVAFSHGSLPGYGDRTSLDVPSPLGLRVVLNKHGRAAPALLQCLLPGQRLLQGHRGISPGKTTAEDENAFRVS
jgi:hypothetical protein